MAKQTGKGGDEVLLNISVSGRDELKGASDEAKALNKELSNGGKVDVSGTKTLKAQIREATLEAQKLVVEGKKGTEEFRSAAKRVADLKDEQEELNRTFQAFDPDNKFKVFANAAAGGAKVVQGYAGAMSLLGVESETATETLAKLAGVMALSDAISSLADIKDSFGDFLTLLGIGTVKTTELTTAQAANTVAMEAGAVAIEGVTVAEEGATVASYTLGTALKAIGIGLIISALAFLISNFDSVKKTVVDLFPALGDATESFNKIKEVVFGVGNALLQFLVAPIKILFHLLTGDFKAAVEDFKKGTDVVANYQKGAADEAKKIAEDARVERVKKEIEANERIIKERKALGKSTYDLEVANQKLRLETLDKSDKDYNKNRAQNESDLTVIINTETKRRADLAEAKRKEEEEKRKADIEKIKQQNIAAQKVIDASKSDAQKVELAQINDKYKQEFELLKRRKKDIKDYNQEVANLTEARNIEISSVNKKYNILARDFIADVGVKEYDSYAEKIIAISSRANELLLTATAENAAKIKVARDAAMLRLSTEANASDASQRANTGLTIAEDTNRPNQSDTAEQATAKINAIETAKLAAENASYQLKKLQLQGQYLELEQLEADHHKALTDTEEQAAAARTEIATREKEAKLSLYDAVSQAIAVASEIAGKSTVAGKGLAVASATISTYLAAQKAYESAFLPVPTIASPALGAVSAGVAVATGLLNIKNILKVNVPGSSGSGGGGGAAAPSAPVINSTILNQNKTGSGDIVSAVNNNTAQKLTARAYIVDKDLKDNASRANYFNQQSTY